VDDDDDEAVDALLDGLDLAHVVSHVCSPKHVSAERECGVEWRRQCFG
jgi:hypothetical protein